MTRLSCIIPIYNALDDVKILFKSILENFNFHIGEVIIVDNGSTDKSKEYIMGNDFNFPVILIENTENLGFSPAVNQGIMKAKYEYIFSLNNDTQVKKGSIKALIDLISSRPKIIFPPFSLSILSSGQDAPI